MTKALTKLMRRQSKFNFGNGAITVIVPSDVAPLIQLYATGLRAIHAYHLAYFPEVFLDAYEEDDVRAALPILQEARITLANGNKRRLAEMGPVSDSWSKEAKALILLANAHSARQAMLESALRVSPPDEEAEIVTLHARVVAESMMAAYIHQYCFSPLVPQWECPVYLNVSNFRVDPKLPLSFTTGRRIPSIPTLPSTGDAA